MARIREKTLKFPGLNNTYTFADEADLFDASVDCVAGKYYIYAGDLYRCKVNHTGAWSASDFTLVKLGNEVYGLSDAGVYNVGNLMNDGNTIPGWINAAGWRSAQIDPTKLQRLTDFIPVTVGEKYVAYSEQPNSVENISIVFSFYSQAKDGNTAFVSQIGGFSGTDYENTKYWFASVTVPSGANFMRVHLDTYGLPTYYLFNVSKKETPTLQALRAKYLISDVEQFAKDASVDSYSWFLSEKIDYSNVENGYYYNSSAVKSQISGWCNYSFPVEKGIYAYTLFSNATSSIGAVVLDVDGTKTVISTGISNNVTVVENTGLIKVEEDSTIYISQRTSDVLPKIYLARFNVNSFDPIYTPDSTLASSYVSLNGTISSASNWTTQIYNLEKNKIYRAIANVKGGSAAAIISIANDDLTNIKVLKKGNSLTTFTLHDEYAIGEDNYTKLLLSFPTTADTKYYIVLSAFNLFYEDRDNGLDYVKIAVNSDSTHQTRDDMSSLSGKTWNAVGDSITAQGLYISPVEAELSVDATNCGVTSSTIAVNNTYLTASSMVEKVCGLNGNTAYADADIWTIMGGLNDQLYNSPLGDKYSTDTSTVYGALKAICDNIRKRENNPLLILITPTQSTRNGDYMLKLRQAIIDVGMMYACPVIDAYSQAGVNPSNLNNLTSDGVHINSAGASFLYPLIVSAFEQFT